MRWSVLKAFWSNFLYLVTELPFKKCTERIPVPCSSASKNFGLALRGEVRCGRGERFRSSPSSDCLVSHTSPLLPPNLPRRRPGRTNTGYCTARQELPSPESTRELPRCCRKSWAQAERLPRPRECRAAPRPGWAGRVQHRDRSPRFTSAAVLGCIHPYCLKFFTSHLKKPF